MELTEPGLRVKNAEKMQQSKRASGEEIRPAVSVIMPVYNGEKYPFYSLFYYVAYVFKQINAIQPA